MSFYYPQFTESKSLVGTYFRLKASVLERDKFQLCNYAVSQLDEDKCVDLHKRSVCRCTHERQQHVGQMLITLPNATLKGAQIPQRLSCVRTRFCNDVFYCLRMPQAVQIRFGWQIQRTTKFLIFPTLTSVNVFSHRTRWGGGCSEIILKTAFCDEDCGLPLLAG